MHYLQNWPLGFYIRYCMYVYCIRAHGLGKLLAADMWVKNWLGHMCIDITILLYIFTGRQRKSKVKKKIEILFYTERP